MFEIFSIRVKVKVDGSVRNTFHQLIKIGLIVRTEDTQLYLFRYETIFQLDYWCTFHISNESNGSVSHDNKSQNLLRLI